ncbi:MAG: hypothetical protein A2Y81_00290 [Nitrospirae bacterium RBG_13_43_8]|nr:MAG: hypothetical protein A2Y81_00290 [Nitrospirae bacterium RBG_13_43_8]
MMRVQAAFISVFVFFIFPAFALSDVIVHDSIVPVGKEIMLGAEVKGKLFSKGGEMVEFFVNDKSIGKNLSGGDGLAFKQFVPSGIGIYRIKAKSGTDEGRGLLLSLRKGSGIVFVDVEESLMEKFSNNPEQGSRKVIKKIQKKFPVVLLHTTGFLNVKSIKEWLKKNEFPEVPVLPWKQGSVFGDLHEEGFRIKAVIGSPAVIYSAKEYKPLAFTFEETEDAVEVKDWEEIGKKLK